jgi:cellulose synthase/poly-beta-1,6-N-acetylglucosamine synthase-like glycosyltransferase
MTGIDLFWHIYTVMMFLLAAYGLHRYGLVWMWFRHRKRVFFHQTPRVWPMVTVQLPIFNESEVVRRLVEGALALDYPRECIEFQLLDDSTDGTKDVAARIVAEARAQGVAIEYFHRTDRKGFKAGALHEGLRVARGAFVAVFDADFVPRPQFLKTLVPYFANKKVGMVQATWAHFNHRSAMLTRLQEVLTVSHFSVEQAARSHAGRFFNFNGTCGIWRRAAIDAAGGWEGDTLAEDLDLSYRAQLNGWNFVYIDQVLADAELPADMNAFKKQQERWTRGTVQVARKLFIPVLMSRIPFKVKLEALLHLTSNAAYPLGLMAAMLVIPSVFLRLYVPGHGHIWDLLIFIGLTFAAFFYHSFGQWVRYGVKGLRHLPAVCVAVLAPLGLSLILSIAAVKGLFGKTSVFVRTPKTGAASGSRKKQSGGMAPISVIVAVELTLAVIFGWGAAFVYGRGYPANATVLLLFACGFSYVGALSSKGNIVKHLR